MTSTPSPSLSMPLHYNRLVALKVRSRD